MFDRLFGKFAEDLGIDLGTANTLVYVKGKGIVINEPSVVAINQRTKQIMAIGSEAERMVGRTPSHIVAMRPLVDGVISDLEVTESMLRYFIDKVHHKTIPFLRRPRVVIGIPCGVTEVERRAVQDAALNAGARQAFLIEEPMAASIGARLPVQEANGSMVVDIGGGTTEIAILSLGGVVMAQSLRLAGDQMNEAIIQYLREQLGIHVGVRSAEGLKIQLGSALPLEQPITSEVRGRDLATGLPKSVRVTDEHVRDALAPAIRQIVTAVKHVIEQSPPEIVADVMQRGIVLAGGGAMLRGLDLVLSHETQISVIVADDPLTCVARGAGMVVEDLDGLKDVLMITDYERIPR